MRGIYEGSSDQFEDACDLDTLLHPSQAFEHPSEVVRDPDLTLNEKRAILAREKVAGRRLWVRGGGRALA